VEQRKEQRVQDKKQREAKAAARKAAAQDAKEAKQAQRQLQNDSRKLNKLNRKQNNLILALEELEITAGGGKEVGVVESAAQRPQRQKRLPQHLKGCEIELA